MYQPEKAASNPPSKSSPFKKICVYCGSKPGKRAGYLQAADDLGNELLKRNIGLVYGGGRIGLMGRIADCMIAGGGETLGIIPQSLLSQEVAHTGLSELKTVGSMHERKALMEKHSDGFIAMPGGLGTLEELFETLTWAQLGFHKKPCGVLNACGYYDNLVSVVDQALEEGFIKPAHRELMILDDNPARLLERMEAFVPTR